MSNNHEELMAIKLEQLDEEPEITIEWCPEIESGEHLPDVRGRCVNCDFYAEHSEWWDIFVGGD